MNQYPLPPGLKHEQPIRVIAHGVEPGFDVRVKDEHGNIFQLHFWQVDVGHEINIGGTYYHESHPMAVAYLYDSLRPRPWPIHDTFMEVERVRRAKLMLERNGYDPDRSPESQD